MSVDNSWDEHSWRELLGYIHDRELIPIVGSGLVTVTSDGKQEPFTKWLGSKLPGELYKDRKLGGSELDVNQVVGTIFRTDHEVTSNRLHSVISSIIEDNRFEPSQPLIDLARINDFNLFVTTTYEGMLQAALEKERHGSKANILNLWPAKRRKDLPADWEDKTEETTLVYLLGSCSDSPHFAAWDADVIDYVLDLYAALKADELRILSYALREKKLLFLGTSFGDWLTRFFIHLARQSPWTNNTSEAYIAEQQELAAESLVVFFRGTRRSTQFISGDPAGFVGELYKRWTEKFAISEEAKGDTPGSADTGKVPNRGAVFISYAREDKSSQKSL